MVTGESQLVHKQIDDEVIGSTVNGTGSFNLTAKRVGADTVLSQIIRMVESTELKPPIQRLGTGLSYYLCRLSSVLQH